MQSKVSCTLNVTDVRSRRPNPKKSKKALAELAEDAPAPPKRKRADPSTAVGPGKRVRVKEPIRSTPSPPPSPRTRGTGALKRNASSQPTSGPSSAPTDTMHLQAELFARRSSVAFFATMTRYMDAMRSMAEREIADLTVALEAAESEPRKRQSSRGKGKERERD